jgi:hypothetical protein
VVAGVGYLYDNDTEDVVNDALRQLAKEYGSESLEFQAIFTIYGNTAAEPYEQGKAAALDHVATLAQNVCANGTFTPASASSTPATVATEPVSTTTDCVGDLAQDSGAATPETAVTALIHADQDDDRSAALRVAGPECVDGLFTSTPSAPLELNACTQTGLGGSSGAGASFDCSATAQDHGTVIYLTVTEAAGDTSHPYYWVTGIDLG